MSMGTCIVNILQYTSNKMQRYTVYFIWKLFYMFRVIPSPIIRSAKQLYLQHLVFVTPLLLPALIAASSSNGVTKRKSFGHRSSRLNAHRHTLQYLVQRKRERERERKREREITESENCRENKKWKREAKLLENKRINFVMRLIAKHFCGLWPHTWENRLSFSLTQECLSSKQHLKFAVL